MPFFALFFIKILQKHGKKTENPWKKEILTKVWSATPKPWTKYATMEHFFHLNLTVKPDNSLDRFRLKNIIFAFFYSSRNLVLVSNRSVLFSFLSLLPCLLAVLSFFSFFLFFFFFLSFCGLVTQGWIKE